MKVLVTGAFGYLGGRVAQHLAAEGIQPVLGSRRAQPSPVWLFGADVVAMDWRSEASLSSACEGCDAIVHFAGMNAQESAVNAALALEVNGQATGRLVDAASAKGVRQFIYFSTAHVYASRLVGRITENTPPTNPHPYATTHLAGERETCERGVSGSIDAVVIRLSNAFGAPTHKDAGCWTLLVNDLCRQAVTTGQLVLRSTGLDRRDFIPIADVCRAVSHILHRTNEVKQATTYNLGGAWSPTVMEMATLIQERCSKVLGARLEITRPDPTGNDKSVPLDFSIDAIRRSGYEGLGDHAGEIDRLLAFCMESFA